MNLADYDRNIELLCPTCGGGKFQHGQDLDQAVALVWCVGCNREITKDELIRENAESIHAHLGEIQKEALGDIAKDLKKSLQKAFKGSNNISIK